MTWLSHVISLSQACVSHILCHRHTLVWLTHSLFLKKNSFLYGKFRAQVFCWVIKFFHRFYTHSLTYSISTYYSPGCLPSIISTEIKRQICGQIKGLRLLFAVPRSKYLHLTLFECSEKCFNNFSRKTKTVFCRDFMKISHSLQNSAFCVGMQYS